MKQAILFIGCLLCLLGCTQKRSNSTEEFATVDLATINDNEQASQNTIKYNTMSIVDSLFKEYPNVFENDIQSKKYANAVWDAVDAALSKDNMFLSDVPLQFSQMLPNGNQYILKFECGEYSTKDNNLKSTANDIQINFAIYTVADEDLAATLIDRAIYHVEGKYVGKLQGYLVLPSGNVFDYTASCYKASSDIYGTLCIGGYLFDDISFKLIKKQD